MPGLLLISLATLISEDLTCIATGVLVAQGKIELWAGTAACLFGIYAGDLALFLAGRLAGRAALNWAPFRRFMPAAQVERASAWISARGLRVVFLSRFAPGLRLPTYFVAGLLKTRLRNFALYFLAAAAIWTPLLVGSAALFGEQSARIFYLRGTRAAVEFLTVFMVALAIRWMLQVVLSYRVRRRLAGFLQRKIRWEFWPPWAAYLPVIPYIAYLSLKHRSSTLFTAANPGMSSGGFVAESKSAILRHLSQAEGVVPRFSTISGTLTTEARIQKASAFLEQHELNFPVVLKPDVGERGTDVAVVRSRSEMEEYLRRAERDTIVQEYVDGLEFGVFYYRYPCEARGRIFSITEKHFPEVVGDGRSTVEELIRRDPRAVCMARSYLQRSRRPVDAAPAPGERVRLVEIGSHCRGALFRDAGSLKTVELEDAIDRISRQHPGFFFGRYDIRATSVQGFQNGQGFKVIELNGVSAEAAHIYDPAISLLEAYRVLFAQWRIAFEIGARNRELGARPMGLVALLKLIGNRRSPEVGDGTIPKHGFRPAAGGEQWADGYASSTVRRGCLQ